MRLINLDRKALGKAPYLIDARLADIARNAHSPARRTRGSRFHGRARDMADRGYFSHTVPGCYSSGTTPYRSIAIVRKVFGYAGARSEILHWNSYGTAKTTYHLGCDIHGKACRGAHDDCAVHGDPRPAQLHELGAAPRRGTQQLPAVRAAGRPGCRARRRRTSPACSPTAVRPSRAAPLRPLRAPARPDDHDGARPVPA